jgi:hypothetical protein
MSDTLACLPDADFDALAAGRAAEAELSRLRGLVQAVLDDPDDGVSHEEVWSRLEERMRRAVDRAA